MLIYAKQPIGYMLKNHPQKIKRLYLAKELDKKEYSSLMRTGIEIKRIPPEAAGKMCKNASHQGILAEVEDYDLCGYRSFLDYEYVLVLSGLTDVGNIGALIRSAYALGVEAVIACGVKSLPLEALARTSTGALFDTHFAIEQNIYDVINDLKTSGFYMYGADMGGTDVRSVEVKRKRAVFLGSEGDGLSVKVASKLDEIISIKMAHEFDSLNVSAAGAILMDRMRI